jgi:hypothetical protein
MTLATLSRPARRTDRLSRPGGSLPRSPKERLWLVGGVTAALLMSAVAYLFFIGPQQAETADVEARIETARSQATILQTRLDQLRQQNKSYARFHAELVAAQQALPTTSGVSDFLRSLQSLGSQTQTNVVSLGVGQPTDVSTRANSLAAPGTGRSAAPARGAVFMLPIHAQVSGLAADLNRFLDQLQNVQPRAVLITSLVETSAPAARGRTTLDLNLQAFVAPASSAEQRSLSQAAGRPR